MNGYEKNIVPHIESIYNTFTSLEKTIADFFIYNTEEIDFSAKHVANKLYVSEASLSRFAKKCGYKGYREFLFYYEQCPVRKSTVEDNKTKKVLSTYQELLNKSYSLVDEAQMQRLVNLFLLKKRIYVYAKGSSGMVGNEMKLRFMRMGIHIEVITDVDTMKMSSVLLDEDSIAIGISVSGRDIILNALKSAKKREAKTILMTSRNNKEYKEYCDEVMLFAVKEHLEKGKVISPQFPILVMIDILFLHILESDRFKRDALYESTLTALDM